MLAVAIVSIIAPLIVGLAISGIRTNALRLASDVRGVALQTVIVIVVLLAIAGAVAGVLITRGGEAVAEAEQQEILVDAGEITNEGLCESYGFSWAAGSCYRSLPTAPLASSFNNQGQTACEDAEHLGRRLNYTWSDDPDETDPLIGTCA